MYTLNTHLKAQISPRFTLWPAIFEIQGCLKSEMHQMTPELSQPPLPFQKYLTLKSTLYTINIHPGFQFHSVSLIEKPFLRYNVVKNRKCTQWPQNDLNHLTVQSIYWTLTPEAQISLRFALRSLVFQIIEVFGFLIGYNGEFQKFVKNQKLKISKIQNSTFVRTTQK